MNIEIPAYVLNLMNTLSKAGYECFIVGGAVRNALLSLPVHDYDLTTNALPDEMKQVFEEYRTLETGIQHGTLTVICDHKPVEITTYRRDSAYSDHRHPDRVEFASALREDCARRDFTVNALCSDADGNLYDFFEGRKDLEKGVIRCIGDPDERFNEDALRILRALRFAARLSFSIDENTSASLIRNKELLHYISTERIREELKGFLEAEGSPDLFIKYYEVFTVFIPELNGYDLSERETLFRSLSRTENDALVRFALIVSQADQPLQIMKALKFSNHESRSVMNLLALKDRPVSTPADIRRIIRDLEVPFEQFVNYRCALDVTAERRILETTASKIMEDHACCTLKDLAVSGRDLLAAGLRGKEIADSLNLLLDRVIDQELPNEKDALINYVNSIRQ